MKIINLVMAVTMVLLLPTSVLAEEAMPDTEMVGNITYVSGGIGESEAEMMKGVAKDYPLEIAFVQKLKQKEEFLADVKVQLQDAHGNIVLDVVSDGPYLFANLPQGKYLVIAEHNGDSKRQWVHIQSKKHKKIVFWWPILDQSEIESLLE
ncbi:MAG: hypothetical protein Q8K83_02505 [Methylotenera sp.]|jgi:hypothetical protein|nr:hypothetical protein [Methylotenera sp.]PKO53239.1 MAG: hypothetical protein CVU27_02050 [Betaproteobacteria bacterium HGW-Betaproteobacteria-20]